MEEGRVVRSYGNVHFVDVGDEVLVCRPRGRLRFRQERVLTGDRVRVSRAGPGLAAIDEVFARKNEFSKPPVANVDQVILVFSFHEPELDLALLDRFLVLTAAEELGAVLCLNKVDLAGPGEASAVRRVYEPLGYPVAVTSAKTREGLGALAGFLEGRLSVLAGPSGVGKSSLLNAFDPSLALPTGSVSRKVRRGTHTTRHVALIRVGGGLVADTPGFSQLGFEDLGPSELAWLYPELAGLAPGCRFRGCLHRTEPGCRVKEAVTQGVVDQGRYARYLTLLQEAEATYKRW